MKTLVYGAGPLGSLLAGRLHAAGVDVSLLARGRRLADLREHGLILEDAFSGAREVYCVPLVEELREDDPYELVLVVMSKDHSRAVLPALARNRHAETVLFLQNNPSGFDEHVTMLGAERVMVGFPVAGGERRGPVMRVMPLDRVAMPVGEVDGHVTERTRRVAALLGCSGKRVQIRRDMDAWLVTHVPAIVVFGGLYAADLDAARFSRTRDAMLLGVRAREEGLRAQSAAGIPIRPPWFRTLPLVPEPLAVALLKAMAGAAFFEVGVVGHSRAAPGEMIRLMEEFQGRLASGGVPMPHLQRILAHARGDLPPLPDGSSDLPLRWGGLVAWLAAATAVAVAFVMLRKRR